MSWRSVYRMALRTLPRGIRHKHGQSMEALFAHELSRARRTGWLRSAATGTVAVFDVIRRGLYERRAQSRNQRDLAKVLRRADRWSWDALGQDIRFSVRSLFKAPRFTTVVVLTLGLGVGANTAIFSVVDTLLLRPLPFPNAGRVVNLAWARATYLEAGLSPVKFEYWQHHARSFDAMATWEGFSARTRSDGEAAVVRALRVSDDFFRVLGFEPTVGRGFTAGEHVPDGPRIVILSHALWRSRFASDTTVLGREINLNEEPYTIIGVLPEAFVFPYEHEPVEAIVPLGFTVDPSDEGANWPAIARLREGVTYENARAEIAALTAPFQAVYPTQLYDGDRGMTLATFGEIYIDANTTRVLWILMGTVGLVLAIACANVASLLLARAATRRGEIALRAALGATRGRIVLLVVTESVLLSLMAAVVALPMASWCVDLLVALAPIEVPREAAIGIDWRVLFFTFLIALVTGLLGGGVAAWPAWGTRLSEVLKDGARASSSRRRGLQALLAAQSALSTMLLVGATLLVVTLISLRGVDPGFDPEGLVAVRVPFKPAGYETSRALWEFEQRVAEQLQGSAAVEAVVGASNLPLERGTNFPMSIGGRPDEYEGAVEWRAVTPGYFRLLSIDTIAGRRFETTDLEGGPPVVIINEAFASKYFPNESPIGHRIEIGRFRGEYRDASLAGPGAEVVGVVADIREVSLRTAPRRTMYVPQAQAPTGITNVRGQMPVLIVRGRFGRNIQQAVTDALLAVDPALPRPEVFPLGEVITRSLTRERFAAVLISGFAGLALLITASGIYSALAYMIRQRRREIGIRMALGADEKAVMRLVLAQGTTPVFLGLLTGLAGSVGLSEIVTRFMWGATPSDIRVLAAVGAILLGVAVVASWLPAREAVGVDPVNTLKSE